MERRHVVFVYEFVYKKYCASKQITPRYRIKSAHQVIVSNQNPLFDKKTPSIFSCIISLIIMFKLPTFDGTFCC